MARLASMQSHLQNRCPSAEAVDDQNRSQHEGRPGSHLPRLPGQLGPGRSSALLDRLQSHVQGFGLVRKEDEGKGVGRGCWVLS